MARRVPIRILAVLLLVPAPSPALGQHAQDLVLLPKQLAAPPGDILSGRLRLPDPADLPSVSRLAVLPVTLTRDPDGSLSWSADVAIDDASRVRIALLAPPGEALEWTVTMPATEVVGAGPQRVAAPVTRIERAALELADAPRDVELRTFTDARPGTWAVRISSVAAAPPIHAQLVVVSDSPHALRTHLTTLGHVTGRPIGVVAAMQTDPAAPAGARISEATLLLTAPDGLTRTLPMLDDGAHDDGAPGDAVFGASFVPASPGPIDATVLANGITGGGAPLVRTSSHRIRVVPGGVTLSPERRAFARALLDDVAPETTLRIDIPAAFEDPTRRCFVAAEVWGHDPATGGPRPSAWTGVMTEPRTDPGADSVLSLHLDSRWLATASITGPFKLRNVRVQDPDTFVPIATRETIPLALDARIVLPNAAPREADRAMLVGRPRADLALAPTIPTDEIDAARAATRDFGAHNLMLVHGWCSGGNVWPAADFTGFTEVFFDPDANRSHDQFAQLILALGNNSKSYGIVGHSQGGCAALHLWTFYFSGLDWAAGPRLIQSVGSPYQGTPLASLGFFTCGVNDDLTPAGSTAWLANIPTAERAAVYYYTTSPSSGNCDFFTNLVLASPNDGVTEVARDQLPGATNMGNTLGWCHTTGMNQPAQYTDHTRNAEMNANAAR